MTTIWFNEHEIVHLRKNRSEVVIGLMMSVKKRKGKEGKKKHDIMSSTISG